MINSVFKLLSFIELHFYIASYGAQQKEQQLQRLDRLKCKKIGCIN